MGPLVLESKTVAMRISREEVLTREFEFGLDTKARLRQLYVVSFTWPISYIGSGRIEVIDDDNKVHLRKDLSDRDIFRWAEFVKKQRGVELSPQAPSVRSKEKTRKQGTQERSIWSDLGDLRSQEDRSERRQVQWSGLDKIHWESNFGLVGAEVMQIPIWNMKKPLRFCVSKKNLEGNIAVCSKRYQLSRRAGRYRLDALKSSVQPSVLINERRVTLKGTAIFLDDTSPIKFSAVLNDGSYYEFVSAPKPTNILDLYHDTKTNEIVAIGYGNPPMGQVEVVRREDQDFWDFLNFFPTIGEFRNFWKARTSMNQPYLYLKGKGGAPFKQNFLFKDLPTDKARVQANKDAPLSTYSKVVRIRGKKPKDVKVSSKEQRAKALGDESFEWEFLAPKKGEFNRSHLFVEHEGKIWKSYYEVYRGYNTELSGRLTGVITSTESVLLLGESAVQYWLESIAGWQNRWLSLQRWGVAARYFQSLAGLNLQEGEEPVLINVANVDLKYRISPGIWGRDPTVGLILGSQAVNVDFQVEGVEPYKSNMLGGGVFWARSMPWFFDQMFNILPFMRYPKWVDWEFITYVVPTNNYTQLGLNFAMNFHGKIQWTDQFFGEAGFGLKNFAFVDIEQKRDFSLGMAYATFGLGYQF
jgi:hypothetical protein